MSSLPSTGFGLSTTLAWGTSNFLGGFASQRANPFLLATISNFSGLSSLLVLAAVLRAGLVDPRTDLERTRRRCGRLRARDFVWVTLERPYGDGVACGRGTLRRNSGDRDHCESGFARFTKITWLCAGNSRGFVNWQDRGQNGKKSSGNGSLGRLWFRGLLIGDKAGRTGLRHPRTE